MFSYTDTALDPYGDQNLVRSSGFEERVKNSDSAPAP